MNALHHCVFNLNCHLVLVTKYRRKCINEKILEYLKTNFDRLCEKWQCEMLEFNGEMDHVHLLLSLAPRVQPSILVNNLKTVSSRLVRRDFGSHMAEFYKKPVFWSRSYCMLSCGGAPLDVIKTYIEKQKGAS